MAYKILNSKYPGICGVCKTPYAVGAKIAWNPDARRETLHAACSDVGKTAKIAVEASRADVDLPVPTGLSYLPYQRAGIAYTLTRPNVLLADEMGLGKTVQAIGAVNASPDVREVTIVCPASLKFNWKNEVLKWSTRPTCVHIVGVDKTAKSYGEMLHPAVIVHVINYDILKKLPAHAANPDLLVLDEVHYCKNPKAQRTKATQALAKRAKRVLALTGTPILNKPVELWPLLQMLDPEAWDPGGWSRGEQKGVGEGAGFFRFAKRYCDAHEEYRGARSYWNFDGASNLDELQERLRSTIMVRRLKGDVLTELPQKRRQLVLLVGGSKDSYASDMTAENYEETLADLRRGKKVSFEEISKVRHSQAVAKAPLVVEHIKDALEGGSSKIVVFAHHRDVIEALEDGLEEYGVVTVTGDTPNEARQNAVEVFQTDPNCRVFIGSIGAAGVGITLTASAHVIFAELDWTPGNVTQAEDRCHRYGQKEAVLVQHLLFEGSLDARIAKILIAKQEVIDAALDDLTSVETSTVTEAVAVINHTTVSAAPNGDVGLSASEIEAIHTGLKYLAERCDGGKELDGQGFNRLDSAFGKALAAQDTLTQRQARAAKKLLGKYSKQF